MSFDETPAWQSRGSEKSKNKVRKDGNWEISRGFWYKSIKERERERESEERRSIKGISKSKGVYNVVQRTRL